MKKKILLVDDSVANVQELIKILHNEFELHFAKNGYEAIDMVVKKGCDLIILDVLMPGLDGYEVCRRLKSDAAHKAIPILFCDSEEHRGSEAIGREVGGAGFIYRPYTDETIQNIHRVIQ